jgi:hypothetical protein
MTRSKIAISLPDDQLARVHQQRESLRKLLRDLIEQHGAPTAKDLKWADRALAPRRG